MEDPKYPLNKHASRRQFLRQQTTNASLLTLGVHVPFAHLFPENLVPLALAGEKVEASGYAKPDLTVLSDRPLNQETPPHLLDDDITPITKMFVRNNGQVPEIALKGDLAGWTLTIDGEVERILNLSMADLQRDFTHYTYQLQIECAGNGRAGFFPPTEGNMWTFGAISCAEWTGVRLKDVLSKAGIKKTAVYTGYYGLDPHLSGDASKVSISRGTPISKALDDHTLLAWAVNGSPLPALHGFPLRLVCPGWPASASGKWLKRITLRDKIHDGEKMTGLSYRMPKFPLKPGTETLTESDTYIIESMPVRSLITSPASGISIGEKNRRKVQCRGFAWAGEAKVNEVHVSYNFGATWIPAKLKAPVNRYAWQRWHAEFELPSKGYFEIWARATDQNGNMQPMAIPQWNPKGYLNNAMHRIAVTVV